jgi:hypothetical protein
MFTPGIASIIISHVNDTTYWIVATGDKDHTFSFSRGVLRSIDEGDNWELINGSGDYKLPGNWYYIRKLIQHPDSQNIIFAATSMGLFKTENALADANAVQWELVEDDQPVTPPAGTENHMGFFDIEFHKTDPSIMFMSIEYRAEHEIEGNEILWSTDGGYTWDMLPDADDYLPVQNEYDYFLSLLELSETNHNIMYIYTKGKGPTFNAMWKYNIETEVWTSLNCPFGSGNGRNGFAVSPVNENLIYAATVNTYVTYDGGVNWTKDNNDYTINQYSKKCPHSDVQDLKFNASGTEIWAASDGGPFMKNTQVPEIGWQNKVNEIGVAIIHYFDQSKIDPNYYVFGGYDVHSQLYDKNQIQYSWTNLGGGDGYGCAFDNDELGTFYASNSYLIYRYVNWQLDATIYPGGAFWTRHVAINPGNHNTIYTSNGDAIYRSFNQGDTWEIIADEDITDPSIDQIFYDMHVAEGDSNYLYLRVVKADGDHARVYKTTNVNETIPANITWELISPNPGFEAWIGDIEVDYEDPDRIWVCYNISSEDKIWEYNGSGWSDLTYNLGECNTGISSLAHLHGTDHGLFASGLHGIFYLEDYSQEWKLYKPGIPTVSKPNLKINYCTGKIVAGTRGRGMWETGLPPGWDDAPEITSDETWDGYQVIMNPVHVPDGVTLTITGEVAFTATGGIVVERGGKLIIDGGILTNTCGDLWYGIEVWGNYNKSQSYTNQGTVVMTNGGTIENAVYGINTISYAPLEGGEEGDPNYAFTGGMVLADGGIFKNNRTAVKFWPYNYSSSSSFFRNCQFITDNKLLQGTDPDNFIEMSDISGVHILGGSFTDTHTVAEPDELTTGIEAYDAGFYVWSYSGQPSIFTGLHYGIKAYALDPSRKVDVLNGHFSNNLRSVYLSSFIHATVTGNNFEINTPFTSDGGYGLYLDNSTGYKVEENNFYHEGQDATGVGLIVHNSGSEPNEIYRNWFTNLTQGVSAQEQNRNFSKPQHGLQFLCNDFDSCEADILVPMPTQSGYGISPSQGFHDLQNPQPEHMAGNLFYIPGPANGDFDDMNNEANDFIYYYPENAPDFPNTQPEDFTDLTITDEPVIFLPNWTYEDGCPSTEEPGGGGSGTEGLRGDMATAEGNITSTEAILAVLVDGGDTEALNTEVETSVPPETMQVYNELMGNSPYLSDTVVSTAIEKEDVLPNAMIRDIMVANPHTAKSNELMDRLDERCNPLPEYMKAQILQGKDIVSIKEELESQLAGYKLQRYKAFNGLVRWFLNDTLNPAAASDSLLMLFQQDNAISSKYSLAMLYLNRDEFQSGMDVLNVIPNQFGLQGDELTAHQDMAIYYSLLMDLINEGKTILEADSLQVSQLLAMEAAQHGMAAVYARNILLALNEIEYVEPIILPDLLKSSEAFEEYHELLNTEPPKQLEVYPNPSDDYIIFSYRNWKSGIYIATLKIDGNSKESIKFTIVK